MSVQTSTNARNARATQAVRVLSMRHARTPKVRNSLHRLEHTASQDPMTAFARQASSTTKQRTLAMVTIVQFSKKTRVSDMDECSRGLYQKKCVTGEHQLFPPS